MGMCGLDLGPNVGPVTGFKSMVMCGSKSEGQCGVGLQAHSGLLSVGTLKGLSGAAS